MAAEHQRRSGHPLNFHHPLSQLQKLGTSLGRRLPPDSFSRSVTVLLSGSALGQILLFGVYPFLSRLYEPREFGLLASYTAIVSILAVVGSLRFELAIPIAESDDAAFSLLKLAIGIPLALTAALEVLFLTWGERLTVAIGIPELHPVLWILPLSFLGACIYQALSYWGMRLRSFRPLSTSKIYQAIGTGTTQLAWGLVHPSTVGLLAGDAVGRAIGTGALSTSLRRRRQSFARVSRTSLQQVALQYRRFPLMSGASGLLNSATLQIPALVMAAIYSPTGAGWFALSARIVGGPATLIGLSISQVYFSHAAKLAREDAGELETLFTQTTRRLLLAAAGPAVCIVVAGPQLFAFAFGEDWREAGVYSQLLAPMFFAQFAITPLSHTLSILQRQDLQFLWDGVRFVSILLVFFLGARLHWDARLTLFIYGMTMVVTYIWLWFLSKATINRMH